VQGRLQVARKELRTEFSSAIAALNLSQLRAPNGFVQRVMETIRNLSPIPKGNVGRFMPSLLIVGVLTITMALFYVMRYRSEENQQQAENQSQNANLVFFDDFDDGDISDWEKGYYKGEQDLDGKLDGTPIALASPDAATSGNYGLQFIKEQWGLYIVAVISSPAFGPLTNRFQVDFDILLDHHHYFIWMGEARPFETYDEQQTHRFGITFNRGRNIRLRASGYPVLGNYIPNKFYHVTMVADLTANFFDVTVAGPSLIDKEGNPVDSLTMTNLVFEYPVSTLGIRCINLWVSSTPTPEFVAVGLDNVSVRDLSIAETESPAQLE